LASSKPKHLESEKHDRPALLWTWLPPSPSVLDLANILNPRYCGLGCPAKSTHFGLNRPPSSGVLGFSNMLDPHHVDLANFQV